MRFNKVLTDIDREYYAATVQDMYNWIPEMTSKKISNALVQQAFVYETVNIFANSHDRILSAGSYQDTAAELLRFMGWPVYDIDPVVNCDLHTYLQRKHFQHEVIISTSVLEHTINDEEFIADICQLLTPNGIAVLTCDFKDDWIPSEKVPYTSNRFYRKIDLLERLPNIFRQYNCEFVDTPDYSAQDNFIYDGIQYSFATMVFKKGK